MATALEIAQITVNRATQNYFRGGMSYCQQFAGNFWETVMGRATPNSYTSAKNAMNASGGLNGDYNAAPPGAYHYFDYSVYGHVGVALGSGLMASGTGWGTNAVANLGKYVYVHRVSDYARHLNYRGWAMTNGARETLVGKVSDANAPAPLTGTQRQSRIGSKRRADATRQSAELQPALSAGEVGNFNGWKHGEFVNDGTNATDIWFRGISGNWFWAGGFTDMGTHDLEDLNSVTPPTPVYVLDPSKYKDVTPDSTLAKWIGSPNYGKRDPAPKDHITLHWMAGRLPGTDATFQNPGEITAEGLGLNAATTYGIGHESDGTLAVHQYVREAEYHHGDGDAASNASGISIEHEGGYAQADGSLANVPDDVIAKSIDLLVDIAVRQGWTELTFGTNVKEHRDYVSTTCPGTLPSQTIAIAANARLQAILHPEEPTDPVEPTDPTDPVEPTDPTDPTDPETPVEPTPESKPKTILGIIITAVIALGVIIAGILTNSLGG